MCPPAPRGTVPSVKPLEPNSRLVIVVDDDDSVRGAVHGALKSIGLDARSFGSAEEFLESGLQFEAGCLITDLQMPGMNGLELQARLARSGCALPTIFITAYGEPRIRAQAMKAGAVDFLDKPFDDNVLLEIVRSVLNN